MLILFALTKSLPGIEAWSDRKNEEVSMAAALTIDRTIIEKRKIGLDHPDFEGHFPNFPLLPAVSQIDIVVDLISSYLGRNVICCAVHKAKFKAMLRPETSITITVDGAGPAKARWSIVDGDIIYSQGLIHFAAL